MQLPYLSGDLRDAFDAWLEATLSRYVPPLTFTELRKGVQALNDLWNRAGSGAALAHRVTEGLGKRAALATYFAALRFLATHHALQMVGEVLGTPREIVDAGCGTGAVGAAVARALAPAARIVGIDRSGWALDEARHTWEAFGLAGRAVRDDLPGGVPFPSRGRLLVLGWSASRLDPGPRERLLARAVAHAKKGGGLLVLEPISRKAGVTWWNEWAERLGPAGVREETIRVAIHRPRFIREMDRAARLDHQVIGARVLVGRKGT